MARRARHEARNPQPIEQEAAIPLRQDILQGTTPHRECLLPPERLQTYRHAIRSACTKLPRIDLSGRRHRVVDIMSLDPSTCACRRRSQLPMLRKVPDQTVPRSPMRPVARPSARARIRCARRVISAAARRVKGSSKMRRGSAPFRIKCANRRPFFVADAPVSLSTCRIDSCGAAADELRAGDNAHPFESQRKGTRIDHTSRGGLES